MIEERIYPILLMLSFPLAAATFIALLYVNAPYGRHQQRGWGPVVPNRLAWLVMESPAVIIFGVLFFIGDASKNLTLLVFLAIWQVHYIHRAFIYPFMITNGSKRMPAATMLMAIGFNTSNAFINGTYLFSLSGGYPPTWLGSPQMITGLVLFLSGFVLNCWADRGLQNLRKPGETTYKIPYGGVYRWISCPNYLGEMLEWTGWAVATWSLPGLAFALWTIANLAPRARANHNWYHQKFPDYPPERKALIPKVW